MSTPQGGIFALGTSSHAYLEFDLRVGVAEDALASALAGLREPRTTMGGVNLVMGFRPTLWRALQPEAMPEAIEDFDRDVVGPDGFTMPATQHDAVVWLSGSAYDVIFDMSLGVIRALGSVASSLPQSRLPRRRRSSARQVSRSRRTPLRCHCCKRRWQVWYGG